MEAAGVPAVKSTCPYCGVGCGVLLTPDGAGGLTVKGDPDHPANFGRLCSKGTQLGQTVGLEDRLLAPVIGWLGKLKEPPTDSNIGENIGNLCAWPGNPRQHAQLLAQAKRLAMRGRPEIRSGALKSVMRCDAKLGPGFVRAFTKDKDPKVAEAARKLLAEPPGQAHMDVL